MRKRGSDAAWYDARPSRRAYRGMRYSSFYLTMRDGVRIAMTLCLPAGLDAMALLPRAVEAGVAYVPGAAFYAHQPDPRALRLSFVTLTPDLIHEGVEKLGRLLHEALEPAMEHAP